MGNLFSEKLEMCISDKVNQIGIQNMDTHELGEAVDMVKDTYEMDMLRSKKRYYDTLVNAMEKSEYGVDYDEYGMLGYPTEERMMNRGRMGYRGQARTADGRFAYPNERMYDDRRDWDDRGMMRSGNYGSRYGYSHDEYMEGRKMAKTPEEKQMLLNNYMDDMYEMTKDMIADMTPEEKAQWKSKITKIVNL